MKIEKYSVKSYFYFVINKEKVFFQINSWFKISKFRLFFLDIVCIDSNWAQSNMMDSTKRFNKRLLISWRKCFPLFCFSLFAIQVTKLTREYNKGKTVVNIEISHLFKDGPPGITICPAGLDGLKMATINDKYKKLHQEYVQVYYNTTNHYFTVKYGAIGNKLHSFRYYVLKNKQGLVQDYSQRL